MLFRLRTSDIWAMFYVIFMYKRRHYDISVFKLFARYFDKFLNINISVLSMLFWTYRCCSEDGLHAIFSISWDYLQTVLSKYDVSVIYTQTLLNCCHNNVSIPGVHLHVYCLENHLHGNFFLDVLSLLILLLSSAILKTSKETVVNYQKFIFSC